MKKKCVIVGEEKDLDPTFFASIIASFKTVKIVKSLDERSSVDSDCVIYTNAKNNNYEKKTIGYMTGTFDLFHIGHLNIIKRAKEYCDCLVVGVHPNASHKGKVTFIPFDERCEIIKSLKYVDDVIEASAEDCDDWEKVHYDFLFVGSDYEGTERFNRYEKILGPKGVKIIYFPYTKTTSSTELRAIINSKISK